MTDLTLTARWTPVDTAGWTRCAFGRRVMLQSNGGTLKTTLKAGDKQIVLNGKIESRMLIELYVNGELLFDELISNDNFNRSIDLPCVTISSSTEIEVHFIPATFGTVLIARDICTAGPLSKKFSKHPKPERVLHHHSFG